MGLGARQLGYQCELCSPLPLILGHVWKSDHSFLVCDVEEITWTSQMHVSYPGDKG